MPNTNTGATSVEVTQLQQSIFNAPAPGTTTSPTTGATKPAAGVDHEMKDAASPESRGQKRQRDEEEEDDDSDVAMEEDSDDD